MEVSKKEVTSVSDTNLQDRKRLQVTVDKKSTGKMLDKMTIPVNEMSLNRMSANEMSQDDASVDKMTVDGKSWRQQNDYENKHFEVSQKLLKRKDYKQTNLNVRREPNF